MKKSKMTLLSVTILASLLLGTVALSVISARSWIWVWWSPRSYEMGLTYPDPWKAYILGFYPRPRDIDPTTIMLEGMYDPESKPELMFWGFILLVPFDGYEVLTALLLKGGHLSPGKNRITLEITGETYEGTPFEASGTITLIKPENPHP